MSNRGFKGFRLPENITKESVEVSMKRMDLDNRYIYWTGNPYKARSQSLRSNSLLALTEKRRPIALKTWINRCAHLVSDDVGYKPERVREGLYLHRNSKPAVFFELEKNARGDYVSVNDVPNADGFQKGLKKGAIVIAAKTEDAGKNLPTKGKPRAIEPVAPKAEAQTEQPTA